MSYDNILDSTCRPAHARNFLVDWLNDLVILEVNCIGFYIYINY